MFTGLIQQVGRLISVNRSAGKTRIVVRAGPWDSPLTLGESISVSGACLTLVELRGSHLVFDVLEETWRRTSLQRKKPGSALNLERALRGQDRLGGHLVMGHVDGTGVLRAWRQVGQDRVMEVAVSPDIARELIPKGSIACDGVSLTLVEVGSDFFSVHIIPHTWSNTALSELVAGDLVNIETDVIGKYVRHYLQQILAQGQVSLETLIRAGFIARS